MYINQLDSPVVTIDLERMDQNIKNMQAFCNEGGFTFRPHIKTHKIPAIAHRQLQAGAIGITCQKIGEAEVMADAGIQDILIYYNILGKSKLERLIQLAKQVRLSLAVDSETVIQAVSYASSVSGTMIGILIDCDTGYQRTGVQSSEEALKLARLIHELPGIEFFGLSTYPITPTTVDWLNKAVSQFQKCGIEVPVVSVGSSGVSKQIFDNGPITEIRAGSYVFCDRGSVHKDWFSYEDCAERVITTIVSRPTETRGILDAGSKTLTSDLPKDLQGYGYIVEYPEADIYQLSEEHGHVDFRRCSKIPQIGERVTVIPNHACGTMNLHNEVYGHRQGEIKVVWSVAARGMVR